MRNFLKLIAQKKAALIAQYLKFNLSCHINNFSSKFTLINV